MGEEQRGRQVPFVKGGTVSRTLPDLAYGLKKFPWLLCKRKMAQE